MLRYEYNVENLLIEGELMVIRILSFAGILFLSLFLIFQYLLRAPYLIGQVYLRLDSGDIAGLVGYLGMSIFVILLTLFFIRKLFKVAFPRNVSN